MNRKQRNLEYIRTKNSIRKGGILTDYYKCNSDATPEQQIEILNRITKQQEKIYKISLKVFDVICDFTNDDFMNDMVTTKIFLKKIL